MAKKKTEDRIEVPVETERTGPIKVKFKNTYVGKLGTFYKDKIYDLPVEIHKLLSIDCERIQS
jgi:hypothetical protein